MLRAVINDEGRKYTFLEGTMAIFNQSLESIYSSLNSSPSGLKDEQVKQSQEKFGTNKINNQKRTSLLVRFFAQFKNLMVIVLLISALISSIIAISTKQYRDLFEGALIFIIVIRNSIPPVRRKWTNHASDAKQT